MTITGAYKKTRTSQPSTQRILFTPLPATQVNGPGITYGNIKAYWSYSGRLF